MNLLLYELNLIYLLPFDQKAYQNPLMAGDAPAEAAFGEDGAVRTVHTPEPVAVVGIPAVHLGHHRDVPEFPVVVVVLLDDDRPGGQSVGSNSEPLGCDGVHIRRRWRCPRHDTFPVSTVDDSQAR